jgi:serine protease AprX
VIALFPQIELSALRSALIHGGVPLQGEPNPAPKVNASRIVEALSNHHVAPVLPTKSPIVIHDPKSSLHSDDPVERSLALTCLIDQGQCTRDRLWAFLEDTSPVVKKTAIYGLKQPINSKERDLYWHHFLQAEEHGGVKSLWCYTLLIQSTKDEINRWLPLITDENIDVRWCVQSFLHQFYKDAPSMIHTPDPDPNLIPEIAAPILEWFKLQN